MLFIVDLCEFVFFIQIPTLVVGPFGCGKTEALCVCVQLLSLHDPTAKVLICTHNNSAADIYVKAIDAEFASKKTLYAILGSQTHWVAYSTEEVG